MRRINAEIQGGKVQEYWRISSLSDAEVQYLDKQKIQDLVGGSIISDPTRISAEKSKYLKPFRHKSPVLQQ